MLLVFFCHNLWQAGLAFGPVFAGDFRSAGSSLALGSFREPVRDLLVAALPCPVLCIAVGFRVCPRLSAGFPVFVGVSLCGGARCCDFLVEQCAPFWAHRRALFEQLLTRRVAFAMFVHPLMAGGFPRLSSSHRLVLRRLAKTAVWMLMERHLCPCSRISQAGLGGEGGRDYDGAVTRGS